jgi:hypothetical protein
VHVTVRSPASHTQGLVVSCVLRRDLLDKPNNRATQFRVFDEHESLHRRQAVRRGEKIGHVGGGDSGLPSREPEARRGRPSLEEERNRHLKDLGNMPQAAGADAIGALLVFPDLLKCQAKGVGNIGLISSMSLRMRRRLPTCSTFRRSIARLVPQPAQNTSSQGVPAISAARIVGEHSMSRLAASCSFRRSMTAFASARAGHRQPAAWH